MKVNKFLSIMLTVVMLTASIPIFGFAADDAASSDLVYKASDAWYEPTTVGVADNTYNGHTEWKWEHKDHRADSNNKWVGLAEFRTDKKYYGMKPTDDLSVAANRNDGETPKIAGAWTTAIAGDWNHPGVGEGWMSPFMQSSHPDNAVSRTFTAPKSGVVELSTEDGFIYGGSANPTSNTHKPAQVRITLNGQKIWPEIDEWLTLPGKAGLGGQTQRFYPVKATISQGDVLRFEVRNGDTTAQYDKYVWWQPVVRYRYEPQSVEPAIRDNVPLNQSFTLTFADALEPLKKENISIDGRAGVDSFSQSEDGTSITVSFKKLKSCKDYNVWVSGVKLSGTDRELFSGFSFTTADVYQKPSYVASDAWSDTTNEDRIWRWLYKDNDTAAETDTAKQYAKYTLTGTGDSGGLAAPVQNEDQSYDYAAASGKAIVFADSESNPGKRNAIGKYWARLSVANDTEPKQSTNNRIVKQFTAPESGRVIISAEDMNGEAKIYDKNLTSANQKGARCRIIIKKDGSPDKEIFEYTFDYASAGSPANGLGVYDFTDIAAELTKGDKLWFEISGETGGSAYAKQVFWNPKVSYDTLHTIDADAEDVTFSTTAGTTLSSFDDVVAQDNVKVTLNARTINLQSLEESESKTAVMYAAAYDSAGNMVSAAKSAPITITKQSAENLSLTIDSMAMPLNDTSGFIKVYLFDDSFNSLGTIGTSPIFGKEAAVKSASAFKGKDTGRVGATATVVLSKDENIRYIGQSTVGADGTFRISVPDAVAAEEGITCANNVAGRLSSPSIPLYVSTSGTADGDGTEAKPLTFEAALEQAEDGGKIIIVGTVALGTDFVWPTTGRTVTVSGKDSNSKLDISGLDDFNIRSNVTFENLTMGCKPAELNKEGLLEGKNRIAANGYHVIIRDSVKTDNIMGTIIGGSFRASVASTNLEVYGGNYSSILGGSNSSGGGAVDVNGDCILTVGGNVNSDINDSDWDADSMRRVVIHGGGYGGSVKGESILTLKDNVKAKYVYGGQNGLNTATNAGKVTVNVEGGSFMNVFAILKNTKSVTGSDNKATAANIEGTVAELTMTGGTAESLMGAQNAILGNIRINALGGTVTRRIIGGTYNEVEKSSNTDGHVTGTTTVVIGKDFGGLSSRELSRGIYPGSRTVQTYEEEISTVIFLGGTYSKFGNMLTDAYHKDAGLSKSKWDYLVNASAGGSVEPVSAGNVKLVPASGNSMLVNDDVYTDESIELTKGKLAKVVFYSGAVPPYISDLTYTPGSGSFNISFKYAAASNNDMLYIALYDGDQLVYAQPKVAVYNGVQNETLSIPYQIEQGKSYTVKAFLWDKTGLIPRCGVSECTVPAQQ